MRVHLPHLSSVLAYNCEQKLLNEPKGALWFGVL
jgi:hypothetical protein